VLSVHTIVSWDFALSILPGWHTTIFPPYFVAGAVFSGFAMVLTLIIPARRWMHFKHVVTLRHLDSMAKVMLCTGLIVAYGYVMEHFAAWYSGNVYEQHVFFFTRPRGPYAWAYYTQMFCNVVVPQMFWFRSARRNIWTLWVGSVRERYGRPSIVAPPEVGWARPRMIRRVVVLPAPFGPRKPRIEPGRASKVRPSTATVLP